MKNTNLMTEMIEQCRSMLVDDGAPAVDQPKPLRPAHLISMCDRMLSHIDEWSAVKLNRWIGFIQCAMIANRIIDLEAAKEMFSRAKMAFDEPGEDLVDHLDPDSAFRLDIGGEG